MKPRKSSEGGFTLVEVLMSMTIFSLISVGIYTVMFSSTRGSETTRSVVQVSEEARLGINRMTRDTREADEIVEAGEEYDDNYFTIHINFNNDFEVADEDSDGIPEEPIYLNTPGNIEIVTYRYNPGTQTITLNDEVLMRGVTPLLDDAGDPLPVFRFYSNLLELDWDDDGVVTWNEVDEASGPAHGVDGVGDVDNDLDEAEWPYLSRVEFAFVVTVDDREAEFVGQSQLRNFRFQPGA